MLEVTLRRLVILTVKHFQLLITVRPHHHACGLESGRFEGVRAAVGPGRPHRHRGVHMDSVLSLTVRDIVSVLLVHLQSARIRHVHRFLHHILTVSFPLHTVLVLRLLLLSELLCQVVRMSIFSHFKLGLSHKFGLQESVIDLHIFVINILLLFLNVIIALIHELPLQL